MNHASFYVKIPVINCNSSILLFHLVITQANKNIFIRLIKSSIRNWYVEIRKVNLYIKKDQLLVLC